MSTSGTSSRSRRYFLNSVIVSALAVAANSSSTRIAGYALTQGFPGKGLVLMLFLCCMMVPFQATIIPAYLITGQARAPELLSRPGPAAVVDDRLHLRLQGDLRRRAALAHRRGKNRRARRMADRLVSDDAAAAEVGGRHERHPRLHLVLEQFFVAADRDPRRQAADASARLARFLCYQEDTTGALYAFCVLVLAPGILLFLLAQKQFIRGLTSGATKG